MIKELNENTALKLKSLNEEEKKAKGVLGRLYGPVASFAAPTRNGRKYTQDLWEKLFESDLIKERFANGGIFGQLCHPDYSEVDMEKIACVMPEPPVKDKDGNLVAYVDLIDTPCGRIAYQLAKYGYKFGISSRGEGDLIDGPDGEEVDPDTYQLNAFDLVEIPAVENARLAFTESLDKKRYNKTLRQTLQESIEKATDEDKVIMNEALDNLGIKLDEEVDEAFYRKDEKTGVEYGINADGNLYLTDGQSGYNLPDTPKNRKAIMSDFDLYIRDPYYESLQERLISTLRDSQEDQEELEEECNNESCSDKDAEEVVNDKSGELVAELQEALLKVKELEDDNLSLQEKLSVCNAKENQLQEQLDKYKKATINLSESAKQAKTLNEDKAKLEEDLNKQSESASRNKARVTSLIEAKKDLVAQLTEAKANVDELNNQISAINEQLEAQSKQLESSNKLVEKYRKNYAALKENYIEVKAANYGIAKSDIKKNLKESYSINDVDSVCKELAEKKSKLSKLPFVINENTNISFKKSSNEYIINESLINDSDDYISDSLLQLANLK